MYKVLKPNKDAYITNRVIKGERATSANVGSAGSLDLFKLYGFTSSGSSPNTELSRLLIKFDLDPLRTLVAAGCIDTSNASFNCSLRLFDVYGGQTTPNNFTAALYPLSRSFDEGLGRDVVFYGDSDVCNFLSGSLTQGAWLLSGCGLGGGLPGTCDYITASTSISQGASLKQTQLFSTGEEDLNIDVTTIVSATLAGLLPDSGFRISFDSSIESDTHSYFVKRFASRTAYNETKRPELVVKYDSSVQDDSLALNFDSPNSVLVLYNYANHRAAHLLSGSSLTPVTGSNCIILKLKTEISGGCYNLLFTGSQHRNGINFVTGVYSASFNIPSTDLTLAAKLAVSGSVKFTPIWGSIDGTVAYLTGTVLTANPATRSSTTLEPKRYTITVTNVQPVYRSDEEVTLRINVFDKSSPVRAVKLPIETPSLVFRDVHYQVRDAITSDIKIPFDITHNSTRLSSDGTGMFFKLDVSNLTKNRSYVIDVMTSAGNNSQIYKDVSPIFRVNDTE